MSAVYPDVSEFQTPANDSFNRDFVMFRIASEYCHQDNNYSANVSWALGARARGKIKQFGGYVIPSVSSNAAVLAAIPGSFPRDAVIMIDMEGWGGLVSGNHSGELNQLADALRARQGGRADLVWGYGNTGDLAAIWPTRPAWLGVIVAGYGGSAPPAVSGRIGWQYTNGTENGSAMPSATPPFGGCDHNVLYAPIPLPGGQDMPLTEAEFQRIRYDGQLDLKYLAQFLASGAYNGVFSQAAMVGIPGGVAVNGQTAAAYQATKDQLHGEVTAPVVAAVQAVATPVIDVAALAVHLAPLLPSAADPVAIAQAVAAHVGLAAK